jgi:hypothetical protein
MHLKWEKEHLKKSMRVRGYVGERKVPVDEKNNATEKIYIREHRKGGAILDVEQEFRKDFDTDDHALAYFDQIHKKVGGEINDSSPDELLLEDGDCAISKPTKMSEIHIACIKETVYPDKVSDIMDNEVVLKTVFDKAEKDSDELTGKMKNRVV